MLEETVVMDRIRKIDESIEALIAEQKSLSAQLLAIKQKQFDVLDSALSSADAEIPVSFPLI